jgi:hypothetical protein
MQAVSAPDMSGIVWSLSRYDEKFDWKYKLTGERNGLRASSAFWTLPDGGGLPLWEGPQLSRAANMVAMGLQRLSEHYGRS